MALGLLVLAAVLLLALTLWRRRTPGFLRPIDAYERLNRSVGLAVENGTRLHISLGRGNLFTARGGSAFASLAMLRRLSERTSVSDRPPHCHVWRCSPYDLIPGYFAVGLSRGRSGGSIPLQHRTFNRTLTIFIRGRDNAHHA